MTCYGLPLQIFTVALAFLGGVSSGPQPQGHQQHQFVQFSKYHKPSNATGPQDHLALPGTLTVSLCLRQATPACNTPGTEHLLISAGDPPSRELALCECEKAVGSPDGLGCEKEGWFISNFELSFGASRLQGARGSPARQFCSNCLFSFTHSTMSAEARPLAPCCCAPQLLQKLTPKTKSLYSCCTCLEAVAAHLLLLLPCAVTRRHGACPAFPRNLLPSVPTQCTPSFPEWFYRAGRHPRGSCFYWMPRIHWLWASSNAV